MASVSKTRGDVRLRLGYPDEASLSDGMIDELMVNVADELVTELNQTNEDWYLQRCVIEVQPYQEEYNIDDIAPGFGKAHFVYTIDPSDSEFRSHPVSIVDELTLRRDYGGGDPASGGVKHSALAFAFVYDQQLGQTKAVVGPIPRESARYQVVFEPAVVRPQAVSEQAFRLQQFNGYVADRIAFKAVHLCKWPEFGQIEDPVLRHRAHVSQRDDIRGTLAVEITRGEELFRRFKKSASQRNDFRRLTFGRRRR